MFFLFSVGVFDKSVANEKCSEVIKRRTPLYCSGGTPMPKRPYKRDTSEMTHSASIWSLVTVFGVSLNKTRLKKANMCFNAVVSAQYLSCLTSFHSCCCTNILRDSLKCKGFLLFFIQTHLPAGRKYLIIPLILSSSVISGSRAGESRNDKIKSSQ